MYIKLYIMCILCGIVTISADVVFNVVSEGNSVKCAQTKQSPADATVLENTAIKLSSRYSSRDKPITANRFQCQDMEGSKIFVESPKKSSKSVQSKTATPSMAGLWNCTILTNQGVGTITPTVVVTIRNKPYIFTAIYCFVKVHIRLLETPQMVLINNMVLPTSRIETTEGDLDHSADYYYTDGFVANVSCVPRNADDTKYQYYIDYNLAKDLDKVFKEEMRRPIKLGYGFRTKLTARHHNSVMICTSIFPNDISTVQLKFILSEEQIKRGYIKTNALITYPNNVGSNRNLPHTYEANYFYLENQLVKLDCDTYNDELKKCKGDKQFPKQYKAPFTATCQLCNNKNEIIEYITIKTSILSKKYKETVRLKADLPEKNTFLEVYTYNGTNERNSWIHYEYDVGDSLDLKCLESKDGDSLLVVKYKYNGTDIKNAVRNRIMLTEDDITFECLVKESSDVESIFDTIYKRIKVLIRKRRPWSTSTSTTTDSAVDPDADETERPSENSALNDIPPNASDIPQWIIILGAILVCIVLVCVITAMYKMMKRKRKDKAVNNYSNFQNQNCQTSSDHPPQWSQNLESNYHVPADVRNDSNIYAEPIRGPDDPYAVPIPKNQRPKKLEDQGPTYAELNLPESDRTKYVNLGEPQYSSVKELYTQVLPKSMRKPNNDYGNVFPDSPYQNSDKTEYVEPTYCQAFRK